MGIKIAKALGCVVTAITRSPSKATYATTRCGADATLLSTDAAAMSAAAGSFDLVLNTIPVEHDYHAFTRLLARGGKQIMLGITTGFVAGLVVDGLTCHTSRVKASGIGGIESTQAVMNLCAEHNIRPDIKVIPVEGINAAFQALDASNESGERHVIDIAGSLNPEAFDRCKGVPAPKISAAAPALTMCGIIGAICNLWCCCRY